MDTDRFISWLLNEKNMSIRASRDVLSRCKRIEKMIEAEKITDNSLQLLIENNQFKSSSMFIKSQLKRTIALVIEYQGIIE